MITGLDIDVLKTFISIADTGSYARAAQEVGRTQSAVSMQIKRLETVLGKAMFVKVGRTNHLTRDGEQMLGYARRIAKLNDEAVAAFSESTFRCKLKLGVVDEYAERYLPDVLARFSRTHPLVQLDVETGCSLELQQKISRDDLHLAIITRSESLVNAELLSRENLVWLTSDRHCIHEVSPLPLALAQHGCARRDMALCALEEAARPHRVVFVSHSGQAVVAAIRAGLAVGAAPMWYLQPGLRVLTGDDGFPVLGSYEVGLLRTTGNMPRAGHVLAEHIRAAMAERAPYRAAPA